VARSAARRAAAYMWLCTESSWNATHHVINMISSELWACGSIHHQDRHSLRSEVPTRVAILYESAHHSRHNALNDLLRSGEAEEPG
jgi:hypothetical protein